MFSSQLLIVVTKTHKQFVFCCNSEFNSEASNEELKQRLQGILEVGTTTILVYYNFESH